MWQVLQDLDRAGGRVRTCIRAYLNKVNVSSSSSPAPSAGRPDDRVCRCVAATWDAACAEASNIVALGHDLGHISTNEVFDAAVLALSSRALVSRMYSTVFCMLESLAF